MTSAAHADTNLPPTVPTAHGLDEPTDTRPLAPWVAGGRIRFRLLGPVEAYDSDGQIELGAAKLRTVLATLVLARGRIASDTRLGEMLWRDEPPATAEAQIQTYVSRLRKKFGDRCPVTRERPGYQLEVGNNQVDLFEFERLAGVGRAAQAAGRTQDAARVFRNALALWHGPALSGVTDALAEAMRPNLEEARLIVLEDRIDADVRLGRHPAMAAELTGLVAAHPMRERLRGQLMTVLHRNGCQAEALATYQEYRRLLADELGIDPGAELRAIHLSILTATPPPARPAPRPTVRTLPRPVPAQLPPDIADFTGRGAEVDQLVGLLRRGQEALRHNVTGVTGMAGVGKTALAVHVAHLCRTEFPDGQLFVDLRGNGPDPVRPADALATLLVGLGVPAAEVPAGFEDRATLYRSRLAGRLVLLVMDSAASEQQLRALLPGSSGSYLLATRRARLTALDGAPSVDLDTLPHDDAVALLDTIVGAGRLTADPDHADEIVIRCGRLPLALRIAGAKLLAKPHWRPADLAARMADQRGRLAELSFADLDVRAGLMLSYRSLPEPARRAFRLLALLSTPRFSLWAAAVVLDVTVAAVRELIEQLVDVRLLEVSSGPARQPRYGFHTLVRTLALERVADEDTAEERCAALHRAHAKMIIVD